jgi:vacuolar-type H+-ATPase subunit E/Vma4
MSIENIIRRIEDETQAAVAEILKKAEEQAAQIAAEYSRESARRAEELAAKARQRAADEEKRLIVGAQLELSKSSLERKREIIDDVCRTARRKIEALPVDEYRELVRELILRNAVSGREEIVVPALQRDLFTKEYIESLNAERGAGATFTVAGTSDEFGWGVVLREGRRRVDLTLGVLFEQMRERIESEIAAALFPE